MPLVTVINRFTQFKDLLRLAPFDVSTPEGRSQERHRRIALSAVASGTAKAITIATSLVTVPLTLNYLGVERYGLWMTISSVIAMMVFADFGIGNGLMNAVAEAYGKDDNGAIRGHVANALVILSMVAVLLVLAFFVVYSKIDWGGFFNVKTRLAIQEAGPALAVFMVCFAVGVPAGVVQRVQMGMQQAFASSLWQAGGSVLGLFLTLFTIHFKGGLPWLVLALSGAPVIVLLLNGTTFFFIQRRDLLPRIACVTGNGIRRILHGGILFFVLQIACSVAFSSDNIIIAKILGADAVAHYSVISKLFEGVLMVIGLAFNPLWPAYGEAKARGDKLWIKKTLARSMICTLGLTVLTAFLLVMFYKPLFAMWVGTKYIFPFALVLWYAIWMILKGLGATYSMFLNGMHVLRLQLVVSILFTAASILCKIYFASVFGLIGILLALVCTYIIFTIIPYAILTQKLLTNASTPDDY